MKLTRAYLNDEGHLCMLPGQYGRTKEGEWMLRLPDRHVGSLRTHEVVEHEDGTITVSPSILHHEPPLSPVHGFLERGVWRDC